MYAINHAYNELKSDTLQLVVASKQSEAEDVFQRIEAQNDKFSSDKSETNYSKTISDLKSSLLQSAMNQIGDPEDKRKKEQENTDQLIILNIGDTTFSDI